MYLRLLAVLFLLATCASGAKVFRSSGANLRLSRSQVTTASPATVEDAEEEGDDALGMQEQEWQEEGEDEEEEESDRVAQVVPTAPKWLPSGRSRPSPKPPQPRQAPKPAASVVVPATHDQHHGPQKKHRLQMMTGHKQVSAKHGQPSSKPSAPNGLAPRTSLSTPEGLEESEDAEAANMSGIPELPPGEVASDTCNPPCVEGRGVCNDKVCFCKMPYKGLRCETVQAFGPSRVSPGIAGLMVFVAFLAGMVLTCGIIHLFSTASAAATAPKAVTANKRAKETWRPK